MTAAAAPVPPQPNAAEPLAPPSQREFFLSLCERCLFFFKEIRSCLGSGFRSAIRTPQRCHRMEKGTEAEGQTEVFWRVLLAARRVRGVSAVTDQTW